MNIRLLDDNDRYRYLAKRLREHHHQVVFAKALCPLEGQVILDKIPFAYDEEESTYLVNNLPESTYFLSYHIPETIKQQFQKKQKKYLDLSEVQAFRRANSRLTAEGLLYYMLEAIPFSIRSCKLLLAGYGSCGREIYALLSGLSCQVDVLDHVMEEVPSQVGQYYHRLLPECLGNYQIVINTIPEPIFTKAHLEAVKDRLYIFEVASAPGGFTEDYRHHDKVIYRSLPGIPSKRFPETSADSLYEILAELEVI